MLKQILIVFFSTLGKLSPKLAANIAWPLFCTPMSKKISLTDKEKRLVAQAKQTIIEIDNYEIVVFHWLLSAGSLGTANSSSTVLLTHGWAGHALNFASIIEQLHARGHNVIAYDSPAHGRSSGKRTTLLANTQALVKVAEYVGPIDILIGHSFGCLASVFALDLDKGATSLAEVKKMILIAGPNKLTDLFSSFTTALHLPSSVLQIFFTRVQRLLHRPVESISVENLLSTVKAQVLLIHDEKDRVVPFQEAETISKHTHAQLFLTNGLGHSRILSAPNVLSKINDVTG